MNNLFKLINPLEIRDWDKLVLAHNDYTFFHSSSWINVLQETYRYEPIAFANIDRDKMDIAIPAMEINSFMTGKRAVSLPFSDFTEPLVNQDVPFDTIINEIKNVGKIRKWKSFELRGGGRFLGNFSNSYVYEHVLDISENEEKIFSQFRSSTKRNINKAYKEGIEIKFTNSFDSVKHFYKLNCITRKRHGLPPQPFKFFENVYKNLIAKDKGFVILAILNKNVLASNIYLHFGEKALYKYGASELKYQNLRANNLVMWEAIKWYIKKGYKSFSFGRTEPDNEGLRQFKNGWGTNEIKVNYYKYDLFSDELIQDDSKMSTWQKDIFNKMPIPILKVVGNLTYRHFG